MNYGQEASRIANEHGFEYGDVLTLLNGGVDEKKTIQVLGKKQRENERKIAREAREREARQKELEKQEEERKTWTPPQLCTRFIPVAFLRLVPKANEYIEIADEYGLEDPEEYVMRHAMPMKDAREEIRAEWKFETLNIVPFPGVVVWCGLALFTIWFQLWNNPSPWAQESCVITFFFLLWVCNILIRYFCWKPKWMFRLRLKLIQKVDQAIDKTNSVTSRREANHSKKKNEATGRHQKIVRKYFSRIDSYSARFEAESMAKKRIFLMSAIKSLIAGAIAFFLSLAVFGWRPGLVIALVVADVGLPSFNAYGRIRLAKDDKYFERFVIKLRREKAISDVTRPDFIGDFMRDYWITDGKDFI
ncbi:hypothetical protein IKT64_00100 [Candidatus Saccharibacteria bacterium]|nr:hypothetical protein [Candidatus Saccharibacteria bacterium]